MPWDIVSRDGKHCVRKISNNKIMHCYDNEGDAKDYLAALYMHAHKETFVSVSKEDGRWRIRTVSTAALKDREKETFTAECIDYDARIAELTGDYPEYRLFHKKALAIGKVDKMYRVGIFAVDEGWAYDDPFSQEICEKMFSGNDGTWRCSRGFYVLEASGECPNCDENLVIRSKHMVVGFSCPTCKSVHTNYKGVLKELHFRKAKTFDITITDIPAVPWTGVSASRDLSDLEDTMTKKELKEKLLKAGIGEDVINAKLATLTEAQLKEYAEIPEAEILKEFSEEEEADDGAGVEEQVFVLDESSIQEFTNAVRTAVSEEVQKQLKEALSDLEIEVPDVEMKEVPGVAELMETVTEVKELLAKLLDTDEKRLKEKLDDMPRNAKFRILRMKGGGKSYSDDEEEEDEEEVPVMKKKAEALKALQEGVIYDAEGAPVTASLTEFIMGE